VINNARVRPGDRVVVLGPGPIGILCAAMARLAGAQVALEGLERDRVRLEVAKGRLHQRSTIRRITPRGGVSTGRVRAE
jgi:threonine dehydrogenase-like Zn-dependent dehydrogenase